MLNPYFLNGSKNEQSLVQSLVNEQLKMYGVEVYYLPRQYATEKTIIKEVIESKFEHAYPLEAYVDSYEGFGGQGTLLSKFGIQEKDDLTLVISKERFSDYISPFMKDIPNMKGVTHRPREGDLIWFPLGEKLFEIKYVEHEQPFYQLEKNYVYQLRCELFRYEDEVIDTGVEDVDDEITEVSTGYTQTLTVVGVASDALAAATLCSGGSVKEVSITNMGNNYNIAPIVAFSSAPSGGITATGIATITTEYVGCSGPGSGKVSDILITNAGCGYTVAPKITLTTPKGYSGSGAAATTGISTTGSVHLVTVTFGGSGYITPPSIGISTPKHVGAAATAVLGLPSQAGAGVSIISAPISIGASAYLFPHGTTGGVYYKTAPTVTFDPPTGTGNGALGSATIDDPSLYGGTVKSLAITTEGKFYTAAPTVSISHPGTSFVSATVGIVTSGGGGSTTDYSEVTLSGLSPSSFNQTYVRQSTGFVLDTGTVSSGNAVFHADSNYYYYVASTGSFPDSRMLIFSVEDNSWMTVFDLNGTDFTEGNVSNNQAIGFSGIFDDEVTSSNTTADGRNVPTASSDIVYATSGGGGGGGVTGAIDPSLTAFSTTGRAYTTAPTVAITTSGTMVAPSVQAVGIATIHPITGIVTAISFNPSDPWAVGTSATIGAGYTVAPNISFSGSPSPVQATATATVSTAGTVTALSIGNSGFGYNSTPTVSISAPAGVTTQFTATGIATIRFDSISTVGTIGIGSTVITGINTTNMIVGDRVRLGTGYDSHLPEVQTFPDPTHITGIGASTLFISQTTTNVGIATTTIEVGIQNCGIVTGISITYGGGGYVTPPTVTITNDTGEKNYVDEVVGVNTATAGSIVGASSTVSSIYIINSGTKYVLTPDVVVGGIGNTNGGSGSFIFNETIIGSQSGTQARVKNWNSTTNSLEISIVTGDFIVGERIVGQESGADYMISLVTEDDIVDTFADNDTFETEADKIIDFSSENPFGMP